MVAMVTIETPGFKRKRLLTLDKNFLVPSTILLNPGNNYAIVITITITGFSNIVEGTRKFLSKVNNRFRLKPGVSMVTIATILL